VPHTEPPPNPLDASRANDGGSGAPVLFPPVGNFNAVVPLSEIDADSEPPIAAPATALTAESLGVRAATRERAQEEQEVVTLVAAGGTATLLARHDNGPLAVTRRGAGRGRLPD
jgi:hypothetical protein